MDTAIQCSHLSIGYPTQVVQSDLSFSLLQGEMVCVLGQNGCGKSTLLRTFAALLPPLAGTYSFPHAEALPLSMQTAIVLTGSIRIGQTTVREVVAMGRYPYTSFLGKLSADDERIIAASLEEVGLSNEAETFFNSHSDGEKQRILIAKALAQQTPVVLLDEPTAHLDLPNRIRVLQLLRRLAHEQHKLVLISTHELELALALSDRILLMTPQRGIVLDTPQALRAADAFTTAFGIDIFHPLPQA